MATKDKKTEKPIVWGGELCSFGKFLKKHEISREVLAKEFKVTSAYISMLAHGKATPGLGLAVDILRWTRKNNLPEFGCEDWGL